MATNEDRLARAIQELATFSVVDNDLPGVLDRVARLANETLEGSDFVGLMMSVNGRVQTPVFTDEEAPELDAKQYETGTGPCLDSYRDGVVYAISSMHEDTRWAPFAETCLAHGILSTLSVPVQADGETLGALNFYSRTERAFDDDDDRSLGRAFAAQAAVVIGNACAYWDARLLGEQLTRALESRVVIEQAKGILMATGMSADAAFDVLRKASQRENRKVSAVAADVVADAARLAESPPSEPPA